MKYSKNSPILKLMKNVIVFSIMLISILNCNTFNRKTISNLKNEMQQSRNIEEKNQILDQTYSKKDTIPDNQKKEFINFFIDSYKETPYSFVYLQKLYKDPAFLDFNNYIFDFFIENIENPEIFQFVKSEVLKDPTLYNFKLKNKILNLQKKEYAEFLLDLIYLKYEQLDPEIIYIFKTTKLEDSIPILIQSIEENKFIEECFSALSSIPTKESQNYIVNIASDFNHPYRETAISFISKIDNKNLAYSLYIYNLKKPDLQNKVIILKILNGIKEIYPYLNNEQKKELFTVLETLKNTIYKSNVETLLRELQYNFNNEDKELKKELAHNQENKKAIKQNINSQTDLLDKSENIIPPTKTTKEKSKINKKESRVNINNNNNIKNNTNIIKNKTTIKNYQIARILKKLFPDDYKELQLNIHNALLTYSDSNSQKSIFIKSAYKKCSPNKNEKEIQELLKNGLFYEKSLYCILSYTIQQYDRKDLQIFSLQEILNIKRKHAKTLIENINAFK